MKIDGMSSDDFVEKSNRLQLRRALTIDMEELLKDISVEDCYLCLGEVYSNFVTMHLQFTRGDVPREVKLAMLAQVGDKLGIHRFDRSFQAEYGTFCFKGSVKMDFHGVKDFELNLFLFNMDSPNCTIVQKERQVTQVYYEADCKGESNDDSAPR